MAVYMVVRSTAGFRLSVLFLFSVIAIWEQGVCEPTTSTFTQQKDERTRGVICVKLLTGESAFFDARTEMLLKCSKSTCPGLFGCMRCCPSLQVAKVTHEKAVNLVISPPPEKDPLFLSLIGAISTLVFVAVVVGLVICCKGVNKKPSDSLVLNGKVNLTEEVKNVEIPENWSKLSGRSCKMFPKDTKLNFANGGKDKSCKNTVMSV